MSAFSRWFKRKKNPGTASTTLKHNTHPVDHDEHTDAAMHHLHSLLKMTHPDGDWARLNKGRSRSHKRIQDLHDHIKSHVEEVHKRSKAF